MNEFKITDIKEGVSANFEETITAEMMQKFLEISQDTNPFHANEEIAKHYGHRGRVVFGMLTSALYSRLVGVYLPGKFAMLQEVKVSFLKPVYIDDKLSVAGEVTFVNEVGKQIEISASIMNQANEKVSRAKIKAGLYE